MEPLPASARTPPGPPRPPAPPTTDEYPRFRGGGWQSPSRRTSWFEFLKDSWHQLRLMSWPTGRRGARVTVIVLATLTLITLLLIAVDALLGATFDLLPAR